MAKGAALKGLGKAFLKRRATIGGAKAAYPKMSASKALKTLGRPRGADLASSTFRARKDVLRGAQDTPKTLRKEIERVTPAWVGATVGAGTLKIYQELKKGKEAKAKEKKEKLEKTAKHHYEKSKKKKDRKKRGT